MYIYLGICINNVRMLENVQKLEVLDRILNTWISNTSQYMLVKISDFAKEE